jgi:hypothetical protein
MPLALTHLHTLTPCIYEGSGRLPGSLALMACPAPPAPAACRGAEVGAAAAGGAGLPGAAGGSDTPGSPRPPCRPHSDCGRGHPLLTAGAKCAVTVEAWATGPAEQGSRTRLETGEALIVPGRLLAISASAFACWGCTLPPSPCIAVEPLLGWKRSWGELPGCRVVCLSQGSTPMNSCQGLFFLGSLESRAARLAADGRGYGPSRGGQQEIGEHKPVHAVSLLVGNPLFMPTTTLRCCDSSGTEFIA